VYWRARNITQRAEILKLVNAAAQETTVERTIYLIQQAMRSLGMVEVQIIKLILTRYLDHVRLDVADPARQIAVEILATLQAISLPRRSSRE
jgi:ABC-type glutathione transport system ATPase component